MSLFLHLPFRWGAPQPSVATVVPTPLWSAVAASHPQWLVEAPQVMPRFEHIFPEADTGPQWQKVTHVVT